MSTHQNILHPHLQHSILLHISPTSFKKLTPKSRCLNRNIRNKLLATTLVPALPSRTPWRQFLFGAQCPCFNHRSNTYIHNRCYKSEIFVRTKKRKPFIKQHNTQVKKLNNTVVRRQMMNCSSKPRAGRRKHYVYFQRLTLSVS